MFQRRHAKMCTAITYKTHDHYFGRTLDYDFSYKEEVTITPRFYPFSFRRLPSMNSHYAMIGMATVENDYPLYYEATNEKGLSMAGLNFPENACFHPESDTPDNVAPFEFIPWILGQCADVEDARALLSRICLVDIPFSEQYPLSPLHWIISDRETSITVESVRSGIHVYDNPIGVMTNNPTFDVQMLMLNNYLHLSNKEPVNRFSDELSLHTYSRGMGAMGLPGDLSSPSRFVRAAFTKLNGVSGETESESVHQFFHMLGAVSHPRGSVLLPNGKYEITIYTSCCNTDKGIYYYTTYENSRITGVDMRKENLDSRELIRYPLIKDSQILIQNE